MKRLFKAFPEVVLIDSTHDTNTNRYKLFRFVVHDVFCERKVVEIFKENNPDWIKIRVAMTDKAHVITWLKKQATRLAPVVKKEAKSLMRLLVYAKRKEEYEDGKGVLLDLLGGDKAHELYKFFLSNWDANREERVSYLRGNVPHLTNNTHNRIESKWGKIKDVIKDSLSIDQLLSTLVTLQEYGEEQYMMEYHRIGSRPALIDEDPEQSLLGLQLSSFAFDLIEKQFGLATGAGADYNVGLAVPGTATLTSPRTGERHVMYVRKMCNYETVVPPMRYFPTRWIVHSPENNIDVGDISRGGLKQGASPPLSKERAISSSTMYSDTKAIMEKIADRIMTKPQRKVVQARKDKEKVLELAEKYRRG
ncbi:hypothetical protein PHPALM_28392 [Phytophthora palmivora]|uniref:ZSWIM1/3 RNaseH-like domain-containing protein n=1 Tax=Phytophthora palmivora TaxID=4796 RepID=A0A2P4XA77_9STRA|nr:hypothetical protein PHPALM_28392 [Phytophthora palmivora]